MAKHFGMTAMLSDGDFPRQSGCPLRGPHPQAWSLWQGEHARPAVIDFHIEIPSPGSLFWGKRIPEKMVRMGQGEGMQFSSEGI